MESDIALSEVWPTHLLSWAFSSPFVSVPTRWVRSIIVRMTGISYVEGVSWFCCQQEQLRRLRSSDAYAALSNKASPDDILLATEYRTCRALDLADTPAWHRVRSFVAAASL
jgi:hypothetical protein